MSSNNRKGQPGTFSAESILLLGLIGVFAAGVFVINAAVRIAAAFGGPVVEGNIFDVTFSVLLGRLAWSTTATVAAIALGVVVVGLVVLIAVVLGRGRGKRERGDTAARYMGRGRDIEALSQRKTKETAARLGVKDAESPGLPIGITVAGKQPLWSSYEDQRVTVAGMRVGKSTSLVIPEVMEAPGPVVTTSNKRDVVDATRTARAKKGSCWVFDPQNVAEERATWWWDPLSYVTDEVTADKLARHFGTANTGGKSDPHFEENAQALLSALLLAAKVDERPITAVWQWINRPSDLTPIDLLTEHDYQLIADELNGIMSTPDKERGSIYSTARRMARCLTNKQVLRWITPEGDGDPRPQFSAHDFVRQPEGTFYCLSMEGAGSAGPLVAALTVAIYDAAKEFARSQGGRLSVPVVFSLDEAANVCRWRDLPNEYSHAGSRGILFNTVLQSYPQGVEVWGKEGMEKLWSAANVAMYLGGSRQKDWLEDISVLIGEYEKTQRSVQTGRGQRSVSEQVQRERIMTVDELSALPKGRAVVLASGSRPTLVRTVPWMIKPYADEVRESISQHDPEASTTLSEAQAELVAVEQREQGGGQANE